MSPPIEPVLLSSNALNFVSDTQLYQHLMSNRLSGVDLYKYFSFLSYEYYGAVRGAGIRDHAI